MGNKIQFQVIVVNADVGCDHCQDRVSKIVSKMTGELSTYILPPNMCFMNKCVYK